MQPEPVVHTDMSGFPEAFASFAAEPEPSRNWGATLVGTGLLFGVIALSWVSPLQAAVLVLVVLIHELGHYVAMRLTGYRDVRIFFVPGLGAATTGRNVDVGPYQEAFTLLAGPVPGVLIGTALLPIAVLTDHRAWFEVAGLFLGVNAFNLLPFGMLDGGKLVSLGLLRRWPKAERWFGAAGGVMLAVIGLLTGTLVGAGFGVFLVFTQLWGGKLGRLVQALDGSGHRWNVEPRDLDPEARRALYAAALEMTPEAVRSGMPPSHHATWMRNLHQHLVRPKPTLAGSAVILGAWAVSCAVAVVGPVITIAASAIAEEVAGGGDDVDPDAPGEVERW